jgi:Uma2 family endonuclease
MARKGRSIVLEAARWNAFGKEGGPVSTITPTAPISKRSIRPYVLIDGGDQHTVFPGVDRHTYDQLSEAAGERQPVHLIYDGKDLEIVVVGNPHEYFRDLIARIVNALSTGLDIDYLPCGETTWKTPIRGLEADLSYYFDPEKIRVAKEAIARLSTDPGDYPWPDLAI